FHSRDLVGAGRSALPKYSRMTGTLFFRKSLSREISKRIIKQEIDKKGQSNLVDDFEEELTTIE
ncbi:hypothetical protein, partial [Nostoc sp.]|uniref:hypothetical protein n=1 Tax=Nostoc sp. TaxID=1180 RepID=UPI002FFCBD5D